jgi:hypothetical protein
MQPDLFRPRDGMRLGLIYVAVAAAAISFCWIYAALVSPESLRAGGAGRGADEGRRPELTGRGGL